MNLTLPGFFKQQTGQCFLIVVGALWLFWKNGAPSCVLLYVTILGGVFIAFEKLRAMLRPKP